MILLKILIAPRAERYRRSGKLGKEAADAEGFYADLNAIADLQMRAQKHAKINKLLAVAVNASVSDLQAIRCRLA